MEIHGETPKEMKEDSHFEVEIEEASEEATEEVSEGVSEETEAETEEDSEETEIVMILETEVSEEIETWIVIMTGVEGLEVDLIEIEIEVDSEGEIETGVETEDFEVEVGIEMTIERIDMTGRTGRL